MSCVRPLKAYWKNVHRDGITFDPVHSATKVSFKLPCGQCIGCRLEKARQWGMRCLHEAKLWPVNSYVTLTYDNTYLPEGGTLLLRDVQLFMKRLRRNRVGVGTHVDKDGSVTRPIRFFAGGEYGEENGRPHYHLLLFNIGFPDMLYLCDNKRGEPLYTSKELSDYWFQGQATIGAVTFDSAVYCAKYALKKVTGEAAADAYTVYDEDGICYDRKPEFAVMSRRPGIGRGYYEKFGNEVRDHDNVVVNGAECRPPRYYDTLSETVDAASYALNKAKRKRMEVLAREDNTPERLRVKEKLMIFAAQKKERNL